MLFLQPVWYIVSYSIDKKEYGNEKKSVEIIVDIKLLLTFAEVFDDRTSKPIEDRSALL